MQGVTIIIYTLNDLNAEKNPSSSGDLNPKRHAVKACAIGATHQPGWNFSLHSTMLKHQ